jgi:hypothetical protein
MVYRTKIYTLSYQRDTHQIESELRPMSLRLTGKKRTTMSTKFTPKLLQESDGRRTAIKELRRRIEILMTDTGADSYQKQLLCERAAFLSVQLGTMEANSVEGQAIEEGVYTQKVNALCGLLTRLGLDKVTTVEDLSTYLKER